MKRAWLAASTLLVLPCAAWAQQEFASPEPLLPSELGTVEVAQEHFGHMRASLAIIGRISFPGDGNVSDAGLVYSDLWNAGFGVGVEGDLLTALGGGLELGGYLSANYDSFGGSNATDDFGNEIDPDDLHVTTVFVGGKARGHYGPGFYWEGRMGLGVVHYQAVDAVFIDNGFPPVKDQLFRSTTHGAFEIGARAGWGTPHVAVELGIVYRLMGAPQRGKNVSDLIDTDMFDYIALELGLLLRF